jgi:hypothetical protein
LEARPTRGGGSAPEWAFPPPVPKMDFYATFILIQTGTYPEHGRLRPSLAGQLTLSNAGVGGAG